MSGNENLVKYSAFEKMLMGMAKTAWPMFLLAGFMIVIVSFLIVWQTSQTSVDFFFSASKAVREGTDPASIAAHRSFQTVFAWIPGFKFLGMGLLFSAITFNLANIIGALREAGARVQKMLGAEIKALEKPMQAVMFPHLMMIGLLILVVAFIVSLNLAGQSSTYFNHPIEGVLDAAESNSELTRQLATIQSTKAWLEPFKFVGITFLLTGISFALVTIRKILAFQATRLTEIIGSK